jgi:hypothetical protein
VSFKKDVHVALGKQDIKVDVSGTSVVSGQLPYSIGPDDSDWFVEDELKGFPDGSRYLVVELQKKEPFVDWPGPIVAASDDGEEGSQPRKRLVIGGGYDSQKYCIARQKATFQMLKKFQDSKVGDVYATTAILDSANLAKWYFVGKVAGETSISPIASLAAQEVLVKQHARNYLPGVFKEFADEDIVLGLADANTEMRMVETPEPLVRWHGLPAHMEMPEPGLVGFDYEYSDGKGLEPFNILRDENGLPTEELIEDMVLEQARLAEGVKGVDRDKITEIFKGPTTKFKLNPKKDELDGLFPPPEK